MKVSDAFPSKWLSASDLEGKNVRAVIDRVELEAIEQGKPAKPVLYFRNGKKGLVLNKTNATTIADEYGDDTDDWEGQEIILFAVMTEFQGKPVEGVRVRRPAAKDRPQNGGRVQAGGGVGSVRQSGPPEPPQHEDDEIPF